MTELTYSDSFLHRILDECDSVAIVGASANIVRPSYFVFNYLRLKGYQVIPVNPGLAGGELAGTRVAADLSDIPDETGDIHMVDIFRRADAALPIVQQAIEHLLPRGLKAIWMQIGVVNHEAAELAKSHGLDVVMNRCPKMEYQRLVGELSQGGINSGIISSRPPRIIRPKSG